MSTSKGALLRLLLTSAGGKHHLAYHPFARPSQSLSFSRLIPSIFSSSGSTSNVSAGLPRNISAVALGALTPTGGKDVWALADTHVQKWDMKIEGWEELILDVDISSSVISALRDRFGASIAATDEDVDIELIDLAVNG